MIGRTLAHYRITAAIGEGGMGQVYRATDTRLGREVAIKTLPPRLASDSEMIERFQFEARAVAALNHPNVVIIHSVEEAEGVHFLTMELVEGRPLNELIPEGGMGADEILAVAAPLTAALVAAHERNIVHRDLKPGNVMVSSDGRVKVLDFGLAKLSARGAELEAADSAISTAIHTREGIMMGTRQYMAPEQVQGKAVDGRTDIFALGVTLHEMATGRRPFYGRSSADLFAAILRDTPPLVTEVRPDLPEDLARVIRRCLEKDPRSRIQTARDVGNELREIATPGSPPALSGAARPTEPAHSGAARMEGGFWVAVFPFRLRDDDPDLAALAEGLTEDIVTGLSRFSYLRVIARSSTRRLQSAIVDVRSAGREIGARYVMEGSLRQSGTTVRLAVQLIDTGTGTHIWAETYDRALRPGDVFALQDDLTPRIVSTVADEYGVLLHTMSESLRIRPVEEATPYEAVLRSFGYVERLTAAEHEGSRAGLERAVLESPGYADGWAMLSRMYTHEFAHGFNPRPDPLDRALQAAQRAVEAGPSNHLAYLALAQALFFRKEYQTFRNAAERALALNPLDGSTAATMGFEIAGAGDWDRGCALVERAATLNPHHPGWYWFPLGLNAYRQGRYREALELFLKTNMPGYFYTSVVLAATHGQLGDATEFGAAARQLPTDRKDFAVFTREWLAKWLRPELVDHLLDGLRKGGLSLPPSV